MEQNQFHGFSTAKASCQKASERALVRILFEMDSEYKEQKEIHVRLQISEHICSPYHKLAELDSRCSSQGMLRTELARFEGQRGGVRFVSRRNCLMLLRSQLLCDRRKQTTADGEKTEAGFSIPRELDQLATPLRPCPRGRTTYPGQPRSTVWAEGQLPRWFQ